MSAESVAKLTPCSLISSLMVQPTESTLSPFGVFGHWSMESGTPSPSLSRGAGGGGGGAASGGGGGGAAATGGGGVGAPNMNCNPAPNTRSDGSFGP